MKALNILPMDNRTSPLLAGVQVRVALNAESIRPGHSSKRRGIATGSIGPPRTSIWHTPRPVASRARSYELLMQLPRRSYRICAPRVRPLNVPPLRVGEK